VWLIDEESNFPKATDKSLLEKLTSNHTKHPYFVKPKLSDRSFAIKHYAGTVAYTIFNFLDKNRDSLRQEVMDTLAASRKPFLAGLFKADVVDDSKETTMSRGAGGRRTGSKIPTVVSQFHQSLTDLIGTLEMCNPYFVRCIKPNASKAAHVYENELVLAQLRYSGMLETIRIRRAGYPVRFSYKEFHGRYRILLLSCDHANQRRGCQQILESCVPPRGPAPSHGPSGSRHVCVCVCFLVCMRACVFVFPSPCAGVRSVAQGVGRQGKGRLPDGQ
jgi:myosin X